MVKHHHKENLSQKTIIVGERRLILILHFIRNCTAELKLILTAFLLLCSFPTLFQFLPKHISPFNSCITQTVNTLTPPPPAPAPALEEEVLTDGVVKRSLKPVGMASYNFILMSAYRGGNNTFAVIGLSSKPIHVYKHPIYTCEYEYENNNNNSISVRGRTILPDWGYGRVYTTVVINCTFPKSAFVESNAGGKLILHSSVNGGFDSDIKTTDSIISLTESPNSINFSKYVTTTPKYDYLYCGSPLYGDLSPQRIREWIAYHVRLFGKRSHFVIYDAGGVHTEVMEVLRPWIELGFVTVQDVTEEERFDAYYHNQFLVVNDCLHRFRFDAKWLFYFDVDEFVYVTGDGSFEKVMDSVREFTQVTVQQMPMSNQLCVGEDVGEISKKWGLEKLVYKNVKKASRRDRKYAIQPRNVFATGVHLSQNFQGNHFSNTSDLMKYFHYHGTIAQRREPCQRFIDKDYIVVDGIPFERDTNMKNVVDLVKSFEIDTIGPKLELTKQ